MCVNLRHMNILLPTTLGFLIGIWNLTLQQRHALWDIILWMYKVAR